MSSLEEHQRLAEHYAMPIDVDRCPNLATPDYMQAKALASIANSLVVALKLAAIYLKRYEECVDTKPSS